MIRFGLEMFQKLNQVLKSNLQNRIHFYRKKKENINGFIFNIMKPKSKSYRKVKYKDTQESKETDKIIKELKKLLDIP